MPVTELPPANRLPEQYLNPSDRICCGSELNNGESHETMIRFRCRQCGTHKTFRSPWCAKQWTLEKAVAADGTILFEAPKPPPSPKMGRWLYEETIKGHAAAVPWRLLKTEIQESWHTKYDSSVEPCG